jgi:hypothetical protein
MSIGVIRGITRVGLAVALPGRMGRVSTILIELSDGAGVVRQSAAHRRDRRAAAIGARRTEQLITIDGTSEPFLILATATGRRVAVRQHDDLTITLAGRDLDPTTITLEPIPTPPPASSAHNPKCREAWHRHQSASRSAQLSLSEGSRLPCQPVARLPLIRPPAGRT